MCPAPSSVGCGGVWFVSGVDARVKPQPMCSGCCVLELLLFVGVQHFECQSSVASWKVHERYGISGTIHSPWGLSPVCGALRTRILRGEPAEKYSGPAFLLSNAGTKSLHLPLLVLSPPGLPRASRFLMEVPASIGQFRQTKKLSGKQTSLRKHPSNGSRPCRHLLAS